MRFFRSILVVSLFLLSQIANAQTPRDYCQDRRDELVFDGLWTDLASIAEQQDIACRKDWMDGDRAELLACGDPRISEDVMDRFAAFANSRLNPRLNIGNAGTALSPAGRDAAGQTIFSGIGTDPAALRTTNRHVFVGVGLAKNAREATLSFARRMDREITIHMCFFVERAGRTRLMGQRLDLWPNPALPTQSAPNMLEVKWPETFRTDRGNNDTHIVVIGVDFPQSNPARPERLRDVGRLQYENRYDCGECELRGTADLHVHQMAELAFGGRLLWGGHTGDPNVALARERLTGVFSSPRRAVDQLFEILSAPIENWGTVFDVPVDANVLSALFKPGRDDEGFFTVGTAGAPDYELWPHHADRSHQQAHSDWLEFALRDRADTGQNLVFMINSLVNNNFLCSVLTFFDGQGNVPTTGVVGTISEDWRCTDFENLNRQIDAVHALERAQDWYRVALSPWHAEQIIRNGNLAVMLAMESDHPLSGRDGGYNNSDFVDVLDHYMDRGVRSLQVVHEANSEFCGAALHRADMNMLQTWQWPGLSVWEELQQGNPFNIDKGTLRNRLGLTDAGLDLIEAMVERNLPIDLAHGSIACQRDIMQVVPEGFGLYSSHTKFEHLLRPRGRGGNPYHEQPDYGGQVIAREKNFLISEDLEQDYLDHEVMIGLRTASIDVYEPNNFVDTPAGIYYVPNDCPGSAKSFAQQVKYASDRGFTFAYGTDFNTGVSQLGPRFNREDLVFDGNRPPRPSAETRRCYAADSEVDFRFRSTRPVLDPADQWPLSADANLSLDGPAGRNYYIDGLAHIGMLPELTWDLQNEIEAFRLPVSAANRDTPMRGIPAALALSDGARNFIEMWERAYGRQGIGALDPLPADDRLAGVACNEDDQCRSGRCRAQLGGLERDRVCTCLNDGTGCVDGQTCATPALGQNFCVVEGLRMVGESCYTDLACESGRCNARDGREGQCVCNFLRSDNGCREGTRCVPRGQIKVGDAVTDLLFPRFRLTPPLTFENICF